jgi:hypothetical protein
MPATIERERISKTKVAPFTVQADHPRNCDLLLQSIPGCRLRSTIRADRTITDTKTGRKVIPKDQVTALGRLPEIPGMMLSIDPENLKYRIVDPLAGNEQLCDQIVSSFNQDGTRISGKLRGVPTKDGTLDVHRMKTLCREVLSLLDETAVKVVKGNPPSLEDVNGMAGEFLLNPGSQVRNTQPRYERDYESWVEQLTRAGG